MTVYAQDDSREVYGRSSYSWSRVSKHEPCQICGGIDWCGVTSDGRLAHCMRVAEGAVKDASDGGWLHRIGDGEREPSSRRLEAIPQQDVSARLSPDSHNRIARELGQLFPLSDAHHQALRGRGMSDDMIQWRGYRTLTKDGIAKKLRQLCDRCGVEDVLRFPGVLRRVSRHGPYLTLNAQPGLLVPTVNIHGQIVAFRVRPDDAPDGKGKYKWLSAPEGGASSGAPVHVSRPRTVRDALTMWVTEGEIKSDIVSDRYGSVCIGVPGVSIISEVPGIVQALQASLPPGTLLNVVIAFDADKHDPRKPSVLLAERKLAFALAAVAKVFEASWPVSVAKGIDDLLVAGYWPAVNLYPFPPSATVVEDVRRGEVAEAVAEAKAEDDANDLWSVVPHVRGVIERSKWCMLARLFGMHGDGLIFDRPKRCGRWDCGECSKYKMEHEHLPHIVGCLKPLEEVWIGRLTSEDSFHSNVRNARRQGLHPRYIRARRAASDEDNSPWIIANMDLGDRESEWECMASVDAYQFIRTDILYITGIKQVTYCQTWRLPEKPKRETPEHIAYTLPNVFQKKFDELAEQALDNFGILPVYKEPIVDPVVRQFMYHGLRGLRCADNSMDWDLKNEEYEGR